MLHTSDDRDPEATYRELRRTAASDPRAARARLIEIINGDGARLSRLFELMTSSTEGRLRQLVANTAKAQKGNKQISDILIPHLIQWQRFESDEFTRAAIAAALQGLDLAAFSVSKGDQDSRNPGETEPEDLLCSEESVSIYRWVAGRLCHRVRNRLELPVAYLVDAIHEAATIQDDNARISITKRLVEAQQSFKHIARIVEFNVNDEHFHWRPVAVVAWLKKMTERYRATNQSFRLEFTDRSFEHNYSIDASDLLLEIIFWNLWQNISQESDGESVARVGITARDERLFLLIADNGPGFQASHVNEAFKAPLSTQGEERGRGLLEVADAVQRLRGTARLVPVSGQYRIELSFPVALQSRNMT